MMNKRNRWIYLLLLFAIFLLGISAFVFLNSIREDSKIKKQVSGGREFSEFDLLYILSPEKFFHVRISNISHLVVEATNPSEKARILKSFLNNRGIIFSSEVFLNTHYFRIKTKPGDKFPSVIVVRRFYKQPKFALLIDDVGYKWKLLQKFKGKRMKISFAIFPFEVFSRKSAIFLKDNSYQVLLHLPMEPFNYKDPRMIDGMVTTTMSQIQIKLILENAINNLGGVIGLNNHIGSKFTSDPVAMRKLVDILRKKHLFFIDSITSPKSVGWKIAFIDGIPTAKRDVFIDNSLNIEEIERQWERGVRLAQKSGEVLLIGHLHPQTVEVILKKYPELEKNGIKPVFVSDLLY